MKCFDNDFNVLGYRAYIDSLFVYARQKRFREVAPTGSLLQPEAHLLFGNKDRLYAINKSTLVTENLPVRGGWQLKRVTVELECGVPIRGCLSLPVGKPKGLILLGHGSSTTPEHCFNSEVPDYMNAIGARLTEAGFAVWCSFVPHAGNQPSVYNMMALFASQGIAFHHVIISSLNAGIDVFTSLVGAKPKAVGQYGVSGGVYLTLHLLAARGESWPTVLCGDFVDDTEYLVSRDMSLNYGKLMPGYLWMMNGIRPFLIPNIASLTYRAPLYFEVGVEDHGLLPNPLETMYMQGLINKFRAKYREKGSPAALILGTFKGGHEVEGIEATAWLQKSLA
ncbi:hypothetical protein [Ferriphaselus sp. R-1]|uniref:hypothetical protein n=1 Tax=Ferriphaselus sp. R-1 TaxID=1485544 RepID=UPI0012694FC0|nr:hypothetical protein [Ferriphaselus sp. R-1]